nr:IS30 family transposase [Marinobacter changyiensis]
MSRGLAAGVSMRSIALCLGRNPSTISREIQRNGGCHIYRAVDTDLAACKRALRPKICLLAINHRLQKVVANKLPQDWSPEQIAGWLKLNLAGDKSMQISHETIYKSLFIQTRGVFKKKLRKHLRTGRKFRHSRKYQSGYRQRIIDGVSISERPACGAGNSYIAIVVERQTRFTVLVKVDGKETKSVVGALGQHMSHLPSILQQSLTWDRGTEMMSHRVFTMATNMAVYFCDPQSPWQRGTNENINRLLRQYFPNGSSLSGYSQEDLDRYAARLYNRPRKTLRFPTPADKLAEVLR